MDLQYVIAALVVITALFYIGRTMYRSTKGHACETGNCGCEKKVLKKS